MPLTTLEKCSQLGRNLLLYLRHIWRQIMVVTFTCKDCGSAVHVLPKESDNAIKCSVCGKEEENIKFEKSLCEGILEKCPCCEGGEFYKQKDFNRKIGVILFVIAALLTPYTYGISFVVLYLFDFILFKKLGFVAMCYKCGTIFREVGNLEMIPDFDHEINDRYAYEGH